MIELLVVVLIIGILAAIALPTFLGQSDKASDAGAISNARNLSDQVTACVTEKGNIDQCSTASAVDTQLPWGTGSGQVSAARYGGGAEDRYTLAMSSTGNAFLYVTSAAVAPGTVRLCITADGKYPSGGCKAGGLGGFGTF